MGSAPVIQTSFNAGEWAPALYARVDLQKYHSGAALIRNFFVDYRGGATTRPGTRFINKARSNSVRLIPFTASFTVTYVIEMGPGYMRFYNNGAPVMEGATSITSAGAGSPTIWNVADKNASIALSGGSLVATCGGAGDMGVRATNSFSSGKHYFEVTVGSTYAGGDTAIGAMTAAAARDSFGVNCTGGVGVFPAGNIYYNGSVTSSAIGALATGSVVGVAIDLVNLRAWFRKDTGQWNGSGSADPVANIGGIDISAVFGSAAALPVQSFGPSASGSFSTANFGSTAFANGPPTGYSNWLAPGGPAFVFTDTAHGYSNGDWIFVNNAYYIVQNVTTNTFTLTDTFGNTVVSNPFSSLPTPAQRIYTIFTSPYLANDLFLVKYVQNVNQLYLCHPNYPPYVLTLNSATNWTLAPISFQPTISAPTGLGIAISGTAGTSVVSYVVTAVDSNGQESNPSTTITTSTAGAGASATITWSAVTSAVSYNIYRTVLYGSGTVVPSGQPYGYLGSSSSTTFVDTYSTISQFQFTPNFAQVAPTVRNPFSGAGVTSLSLTAPGSGYTSVPTVTLTGGSPLTAATATCYLGAQSVTIANAGSFGYGGGAGYPPSTMTLPNGITLNVSCVLGGGGFWIVSTATIAAQGALSGGHVPANPIAGVANYGVQTNTAASFNITSWGVVQLVLTSPGTGYSGAPSVVFSASGGSGAAATAALGAASAGNPAVPAMIQQRLFLGNLQLSPAQFNLSQPGAPFNFNTSFPLDAADAIQGTLTSTTLHSIKAALPVQSGLLIFTDKAAWLLNGGSPGAPITAIQLVANPQGYSGCSDLPPIITSTDILYVQSKNSIVRDLQYNFYLSNYVGADITVLSSHLFFGYNMVQWTWAEEPFKLLWAVRNDGQMLSLSFAKEQELVAWSHHDTQGNFTTVTSVNEPTQLLNNLDATYVGVLRTIQGQQVVYIERMVELSYPNDYISSWQVDAGIGYSGAPATTFSGAQHLGGQAVTGLADGVVINFTMPASGTFVFGPGGTAGLTGIASASVVTVGLAFLPQLQTLPLDLGEPTVQGKRKKITAVTVRSRQALGLSIGGDATTLVPMKDLVVGNVGSATNGIVTGLVTADARTIIDPRWTVPGQYFIQQSNPYPASILGVIPEVTVGDTASK